MMLSNALVASGLFYLLPLGIGRMVSRIIKSKSSAIAPFVWFMTGSLVVYILTIALHTVLSYLSIPATQDMISRFMIVITVATLFTNLVTIRPRHLQVLVTPAALDTVFLLGISIVSFVLWRIQTPFPFTLNWDVFEHQILADAIASGAMAIRTTALSDTFQFGGYSTLFHALVGISQTITSPEPLAYWWIVELFHVITASAAMYTIARVASNRRFVALVAAVLGAFIFESYVAYTSQFFLPQTVAAVFGAGIWAYTFHQSNARHIRFTPELLLSLVALVLMHFVIGTASALIIVATIVLMPAFRHRPHLSRFLAIAGPLTLYLVLIIIVATVNVGMINQGEAALYQYDLSKLIEFARVFSGYFIFFSVPPAIVYTLLTHNKRMHIVTAVAFGTLAILLSRFPYGLKFYTIGRFAVYTLAAVGIGAAVRPWMNQVTKLFVLGIITLVSCAFLLSNTWYWTLDLVTDSGATLISQDERDTGAYLKQAYGDTNTLLLSDPSTQHILEFASGINTQGGAYMLPETRRIVRTIARSGDTAALIREAYGVVDPIVGDRPSLVVLAMSGRYFAWQGSSETDQMSIGYNIFRPYKLSLQNLQDASAFTFTHGLRVVYQNPSVILVEIRPQRFGTVSEDL